MADAVVRLSDAVALPQKLAAYVRNRTTKLSRLIASGAVARDQYLDNVLAGAGQLFDVPSWKDLADDTPNTSTDNPDTKSETKKIGAFKETAVRVDRNQSWSDMDMVSMLVGDDPFTNVGEAISRYWDRHSQDMFIAIMKGIFADNAAAPSGSEHVQNDLTFDISGLNGGVFQDGVTNFSAEAFLDAALTMGDHMEDLGLITVHSVVYNRMQKNNLIDFIPDAEGRVNIPTFLGRRVIVDDRMPVSSGVYQSWLFGAGAVRWGIGEAKVPAAVTRDETAGAGSGQEKIHSRVVWSMHPVGHAYVGTVAAGVGGPTDAATANNFAHADSWQRVFPERKQIKIARLITREA